MDRLAAEGVRFRNAFVVSALCSPSRKDAVYPATIVGIPPMEDFYIGGASVKLRHLQNELPRDRGPRAAGGRCLPQPRLREHPQDLPDAGLQKSLRTASKHGLWGMGQMMFTKYIVVVDDDMDMHNTSEVLFRLCANTDPQRDSIFTKAQPTCSTTPACPVCVRPRTGLASSRPTAKLPSAANSVLMRRRNSPAKTSGVIGLH
jgi:4-hydroxy-3-polyprenylbenzoate decarboxylase